jgi:hypothetical protein
MIMKPAVAIYPVALQKLQILEILRKLDVMTRAFAVMGANLKNVVVKVRN